MSILKNFLKENKKMTIMTFVFLLIQMVGILLIPFFTEEIVDKGIANRDIQFVYTVAIKMVVVAVIGGVFSVLCTFYTAKLSSLLGKEIRTKLYSHVQELSLEDQKQYGPASLATRSSSDVANIQQVLVMVIQMILPGPIIGIIAIIMTVTVSKTLATIVGLAIIVFFATISYVFYKCLYNMKEIQVRIDKMLSKIREIFMGVKIIRAFDNSKYEQKKTDKAFESYADNMITINRKFAVICPTAFLLLGLVLTCIVWIGGMDVIDGHIQIGTVTAVIEYVTLALLQLLSGALVTVMIPRSIASLNRIETVLNHEPLVKDSKDCKDDELRINGDGVEFKNVVFQYEGSDRPVLNNMTFKCKRGQTVAIIGATASGKSTIGKVLLRFNDIQSGEIKVGGVNIKDVSQNFLRSKISYVPQTSFLFSGTIKENIKYGADNITDEEMKKAAEIAQAKEFIESQSKGYDSFVARGGTNFSGGQKQRLCIARALAKKAEIYVFDDSFSALDNRTDRNLRKAIKENMEDAIVIIVAQKISSIVGADKIIVLDQGEIVGRGTHEELLQNNEVYQRFVKSQQWKEEE